MRGCFLGRMAFGEAWELQRRIWEERASGRLAEDALLFLDHEPVFTLGQGGAEGNVLRTRTPWDGAEVPIVRVNRGGEVTYHGPGQLMLYALCDLRRGDRDVHRHCRRLEEVFRRYLAGLGFEPREERPAQWCCTPVAARSASSPTATRGSRGRWKKRYQAAPRA